MTIIFAIFALLVAVALGGALLVYRQLRRFGRVRAGSASLATLALALLFCPIPVHGGFTFVLEMLVRELRQQQVVFQEQVDTSRQQAFLQRLEQRFAGPIPHAAVAPAHDGWQPVTIAGSGPAAWLELGHQLIWSEAFLWQEATDFTLDKPKAFCSGLAPAGFWALPSEAEMVLFWRAGGAQVGGPTINAVSFSIDEKLLQEIPSVHLGRNGHRFLRCVARTEQAPARGYIDSDIPLADWNSYQLAKTSGRD
jgi:hypothetical protein